MKLINLNKAIAYAKGKDYIKTSSQERALREVFELAKVNAIPIETIDKIRAEITNIPITDTDGHNNNWYREPQAIINDVLQIIDKYRESEG